MLHLFPSITQPSSRYYVGLFKRFFNKWPFEVGQATASHGLGLAAKCAGMYRLGSKLSALRLPLKLTDYITVFLNI